MSQPTAGDMCKREGAHLADLYGPTGLPTLRPALNVIMSPNYTTLGYFFWLCGSDAAVEGMWKMCDGIIYFSQSPSCVNLAVINLMKI